MLCPRFAAGLLPELPAPALYESPQCQLRRLAEEALRGAVPFDEFWAAAVLPSGPLVTRHRRNPPSGCVIWPRDTFDRRNSITAILDTREAWRRAYEGWDPTPGERALAMLGPVLTADGFGALAVEHSEHEHHCVAA